MDLILFSGNDTWPGGLPQYPLGNCGYLSAPMKDQCCYSSLDVSPVTGSAGILSGVDSILPSHDLTDLELSSYLPLGSAGNTYCHLRAQDSSALFGYSEMLLLNDGSCNNPATHPTRCFTNGTLSFYSVEDCTGDFESFILSATNSIDETSRIAGSISTSILAISELASKRVGYTAYIPDGLLVPGFSTLPLISCFVLTVLTTISHAICAIWVTMKWNHNMDIVNSIYMCSQAAWIIYIISYNYNVYTAFDYTTISGFNQWLTCNIIYYLCYGAACYTTICYSILSVQRLTDISSKSIKQCLGGLFILHLAMMFGWYATPICAALGTINMCRSDTVRLFSNWSNQATPLFVLLMFMADTGALLFIANKIITRKWKGVHVWRSISAILRCDATFTTLLALDGAVIGAYYACTAIAVYTNLLGTDRIAMAFSGVTQFWMSLHVNLRLLMFTRLRSWIAKDVTK